MTSKKICTEQNHLEDLFLNNKFIISNHARIRMFQRNMSTDDIREVITRGEIMEGYPDDEPCPAVLFPGFSGGSPCHVVVAQC
ncbi:MAG: DUF4258 domain-containing protein [Methanosarcinaceae archaeon]